MRLLKAATEEVQLRTKIDRNNKEEQKSEGQARWKKKNCMVNSWEKQRDARSKEWWKQVSWNGKARALHMLPKNKHSTNAVKNGSDHHGVSPLWRLYKWKIESVTHVVSLCSVLAGNQYRKRHDKLGKKYTGSCPSWKPIQEEIR